MSEDMSCVGCDQHKKRQMQAKVGSWMKFGEVQAVGMDDITVGVGAIYILQSDA